MMGNKYKLWRQWPSCNQSKTLSYRFNADEVYKTVNSVFFAADSSAAAETPESWFTNSSESASFSTAGDSDDDLSVETVVAGARSERRLFFEPGGDSNSILASDRPSSGDRSAAAALRESVAVAMESDDPYGDFRRSMAEMVETNGVRDWDGLEELLSWYLRVNAKHSHAFIVGAFVDLLVDLAGNFTPEKESAAEETFASAVSRFSSPSERSRSEIREEQRSLNR